MAKKPKRSTRSRSKSSAQKKSSRSVTRAGASKTAASRARKAAGTAGRAKGPQDVAPSFTANDVVASIKWYSDVLGFALKEKWENEGTLMGGSLVLGKVTINLSQDDWKLGRDRKKGQGVRMFITTADDIDGFARAIKSRGGTLDGPPTDDWGYRAFSVTDPDGFKITFMKAL